MSLTAWSRPIAIVFFISLTFPLTATLAKNTEAFPSWWGILDVMISFILASRAFAIAGLAQGKVDKQAEETSYRAYRILHHGIFVLILAFFLFGDRIVWINGLPGIAWRSWLLLYCLPAWFTALRMSDKGRES